MSDVTKLIETAENLGATPLPPAIAEYEDEQNPAIKGEWHIDNPTSADWALSRMGECQAEEEEIAAQEKAAIEAIRRRAGELKARARRGATFFEFKLLEWMSHHRSSIVRGEAKSRAFLHGRIGWRKQPEKLEVKDEAKVTAWLRSLPQTSPLVRVQYEPVMAEVQRLFAETGEIPDGFTVSPERDNPYVKPEAPSTALAKE